MLLDSYDTTVGSMYDLTDIKRELDREFIENTVFTSTLPNNVEIKNLLLVIKESPALKPFNHPIGYKEKVIVDMRGHVTADNMTAIGYKVKGTSNFNLLVLRARIQLLAMSMGVTYLGNIHPFPAIIYGRLVADNLTFKMALNHDDQMRLTILATAFYLAQFDDSQDIETDTSETPTKIILQVARYTHISPDVVTETISGIKTLANINDFVNVAKDKIDNSRINGLNTGLLFSTLTYGWKGVNAKEMMGISLEHPPTWMAVVSTASTERLQKDSPVAKIIKQYSRKKLDEEYVLGLSRALSDY